MCFWLLISILLTPALAEQPWEAVSDKDGIQVFRRQEAGASVFAFRGEADVDVHVSRLIATQRDRNKSLDWVDLLTEIEYRMVGETSAHLYMRYGLSWPIQDRDYVVLREVEYEPEKKVYRVRYQSVDDPQWPEDDCCVRAMAYRTFWQFTALEGGKTHVEVEVFTDPKGAIPTWLVNLVQKDWPHNSITRLSERAMKDDVTPTPELADW